MHDGLSIYQNKYTLQDHFSRLATLSLHSKGQNNIIT